MMPYGDTKNLVNTGLCNGLLPDDTKPLLESMLTFHKWGFVVFAWKQLNSDRTTH